jgi:hypothetical protein
MFVTNILTVLSFVFVFIGYFRWFLTNSECYIYLRKNRIFAALIKFCMSLRGARQDGEMFKLFHLG